MKRLLILLFVYYCSVSAQVEYSENEERSNSSGSFFYVEAANFKSTDKTKTRVDFFVQVPYSSIQFVKRNDNFYANYNVTLTFLDKNKENIISEKLWKEQVNTKDFSQTTSEHNYNMSYKAIDLTAGDYVFKCTVEDADSKQSVTKQFPFTVKNFQDSLDVSDIVLISEYVKDSHGESVVPNVSNLMTNRADSLSFYFDLYSNEEMPVNLEYVLHSIKNDSTITTLIPRDVSPGQTTIYYTFKNVNFKLGDYSLKVILKDRDMHEVTSATKKFYSKIYGMPNSITDLNKAVEQLLYIASPNERDYIEDAKSYNERLDRFIAFWDKKKPNPNVDENPILYEYYRRIEYADKNFKGLGGGWRSDMGMIYVTFGPPSNVERHPFNADSRPYEIWDYYDLDRTFVFVDYTGFGDYRLYNPDYSRWPGYRQ